MNNPNLLFLENGRPVVKSAESLANGPESRQKAVAGMSVGSGADGGILASEADWDASDKRSAVLIKLRGLAREAVLKMGGRIDFEDLHDNGVETDPHITVKYGLRTDDPQAVQQQLVTFGPVAVTIGSSSIFENEEFDVVKLRVASDQLQDMHQSLSALPNDDKHDVYQPHVTIAYVKPGRGEKYVHKFRQLNGQVLEFDQVEFSNRSGELDVIRLDKSEPASESPAESEARTPELVQWNGMVFLSEG